MKNNKALIALFVAVIVCLTCLFTACSDDTQDARDPQIVAIYDSYVANAADKGETPLSYEQWLESIKGAKGDKGDTGAQGAKGDKGDPGEDGKDGEDGEDGEDGKSAYEIWKDAQAKGADTSLAAFIASMAGKNGKDGTNGTNGTNGNDGENGLSAYDIWKANTTSEDKSVEAFLLSLVGAPGTPGAKGDTGAAGISAFEIWKEQQGNENKTVTDFLASLKGANGDPGNDGKDGLTPTIKDGYWYIGETNTQVKAVGADGTDGVTPHIGEDGYWYIGETKTTVKAVGTDGTNGTNGTNGTDGKDGKDGTDGKSAYEIWKEQEGNENKTEEEFFAFLKGAKGDPGAQGEQGAQGEKGEKGEKGDTGSTGAQGEQGIQGVQGDKGDKGDTGRIGFVVTSSEQLAAALTVDNAYVVLAGDITVSQRIDIKKDVVLDLGGKTVTMAEGNTTGQAFNVDGATVTIKNGKIDGTALTQTVGTSDKGECDPIIARNGANVTLSDLDVTIDSATGACVYAFTGSTITIESGTYTNNTDISYGLNSYAKGWKGLTLNQANEATQLVFVKGGTFVGNSPALGDESGKVTSFLVEGYGAVENGTTTTVVKKTEVGTAEQLAAAVAVDNSYIVLTEDISGPLSFTVAKNVVIDLNGHTMSTTAANAVIIANNGANVVVKNGKVISPAGALASANKATLTVEDLDVTAREYCLFARHSATLIVNTGTYTSQDNFVIMTNGTVKKDSEGNVTDDWGHNTIVVNGGTFNGNIQSKGYIAGGIYVANSDEVTVNGGTFNITNGVGIVARCGKTTVNKGVIFNITCDGTITAGKVGDAKIDITIPHELVLDTSANYPGGTPTINNNTSFKVYTHTTNA